MARAKHRWKHAHNQMVALVNKVERQRKHQEMLKEHENIKKSGLKPKTETATDSQGLFRDRLMVGQKALDLLIQVRILVPDFIFFTPY